MYLTAIAETTTQIDLDPQNLTCEIKKRKKNWMSLWKYSVGTFGDLFAPLLRLLFDVEGLTFDNFYSIWAAQEALWNPEVVKDT